MKGKVGKTITYIAFGIYGLAMCILLFGRVPMERAAINLVPMKTVIKCIDFLFSGSYMVRHGVINLFGNIGMFIPLGFFLAAIWNQLRLFPRHILTTAVIIIAVEVVQLITLTGTADIDDLILNVLGSAAGFWVYKVYEAIRNRIINKKSEKQIG